MFYRIVLTAIASLLIILCLEITHIEQVIAHSHFSDPQRVMICDEEGRCIGKLECSSNTRDASCSFPVINK